MLRKRQIKLIVDWWIKLIDKESWLMIKCNVLGLGFDRKAISTKKSMSTKTGNCKFLLPWFDAGLDDEGQADRQTKLVVK